MHEARKVRTGLTPIALWCLPSLCGFLAFLTAFLVHSHSLFWTHPHLAEGLFCWSIGIAPAATILGALRLRRRSWARSTPPANRAIAWGLITVSSLLNGFSLAGLGVAFYS